MFVRAPVATIHTVDGGLDAMAAAIADTAESGFAFVRGLGRRRVPSRPDSPSGRCQLSVLFIQTLGIEIRKDGPVIFRVNEDV